MASELVISAFNITYSKSGARVSIPVNQLTVDISGSVIAQGVVSIATSATQITGLAGSPGIVYVKNLDATNYVEVGQDNTTDCIKLTTARPWAIFPLNGTTLYAKANTSACNLQYVVFPA